MRSAPRVSVTTTLLLAVVLTVSCTALVPPPRPLSSVRPARTAAGLARISRPTCAALRPDRREPALEQLSRRSGGAVAQAPSAAAAKPDEATIEASSLLVLGLCCLIGSVCALDRVMISIAILPMSAEFGYSDSTKGLVAAAFSVGYCLGLAPAGVAAATGSPKTVLGLGLVVWSAAQALTPAAAAAGLPALFGARAMMGVGEAAATPCLQSLAAAFVPASRRGQFWGVLSACLSLGTISAYLITPALIDGEGGWPSAFVAFGGAGLVIAALWAVGGANDPSDRSALDRLLLSRSSQAADGAEVPSIAAAASRVDGAAAADVPWRRIAASRPVWALAAAHMSSNFFSYFALSWLPTYFNYAFGLAANDAASASLVPFVAAAAGSLGAGVLCDALVANGMPLTDARKLLQARAAPHAPRPPRPRGRTAAQRATRTPCAMRAPGRFPL